MESKSTSKSIRLAIVSIFLSATTLLAFQNCSGSSSGSADAGNVVIESPVFEIYSAKLQYSPLSAGRPSEVLIEVKDGGQVKTDFQGTATIEDSLNNGICRNSIPIINGRGVGQIYAINNSGFSQLAQVKLKIQNNNPNSSSAVMDAAITSPLESISTRTISLQKLSGTELGPAARSFHSAIYDPNQKRIIIFGGRKANIVGNSEVNQTLFNDVWSFNLESHGWSQLRTTNAPITRYLHSAVYDSKRNRMIIFGGRDGAENKFNDLWSLDLTSLAWTQLNPSGTGPTARTGSTMYFDVTFDRVLILMGGPTNDNIWSLSFTSTNSQGQWFHPTQTYGTEPDTTIQTVYDVRSSLAFIPSANRLVLTPSSLTLSNAADFGWTSHTSTHFGDTFNGSLVYDSVNNQTVSLGGGCCLNFDSNGSAGNYSLNALKLGVDGTKTFPIALHGHSAIYDPENLKMIVFGGETVNKTTSAPVTYSGVFNNDVYMISLPRRDCPQ